MLANDAMNRCRALVLVAFASACADPQPRFGDPGVGDSLVLPGVAGGGAGSTTLFGERAFDPQSPPPPVDTGANIHQTRAAIPINAGTACMGCHARDNPGASTKWAFAGIAFSAPGVPLSEGEVIVADGTARIGPVKTAVDGFFWIPADAGTIGAAAKTAVRDRDGGYSEMTQALDGNGNCNNAGSCHTGTAGPIDFR
jgi:hypothetical protein